MTRRLIPTALACGIAVLALGADTARADDPPSCQVAADAFGENPPLTAIRERLANGLPVTIVAVGGASTLGRAAGGEGFGWPARLAAALAARYPNGRISVLNRAVTGGTAEAELARFEKDVLAEKPNLLIWETGTRDAVAGVDVDGYRDTLQDGVTRMQTAGVEVLFMDPQFSRRTQMILNISRYAETIQNVASANGIGVFPRRDVMRAWAEEGVFDYDVAEPGARVALARRLYDCLGQAVAAYIVR